MRGKQHVRIQLNLYVKGMKKKCMLTPVCPTRGGLRKARPTPKIEFRLTSLNIEQNVNIYLIILIYHYICKKIYNIRIVC